jgi:hypothetical protein
MKIVETRRHLFQKLSLSIDHCPSVSGNAVIHHALVVPNGLVQHRLATPLQEVGFVGRCYKAARRAKFPVLNTAHFCEQFEDTAIERLPQFIRIVTKGGIRNPFGRNPKRQSAAITGVHQLENFGDSFVAHGHSIFHKNLKSQGGRENAVAKRFPKWWHMNTSKKARAGTFI